MVSALFHKPAFALPAIVAFFMILRAFMNAAPDRKRCAGQGVSVPADFEVHLAGSPELCCTAHLAAVVLPASSSKVVPLKNRKAKA